MKVALLFATGFEEIEAITPADLLFRAGAEVVKIGVGSLLVKGAHGIEIKCDLLIEDVDQNFDAIIIPGGMPGSKNLAENEDISLLIKNHWSNGKLIAAICAAPAVVLDPLGLFAGEEVTCYPSFESLFGAEVCYTGKNVVLSNNIITASAAGKAISFSLAIIAYLFGDEIREKISESILY